MSIPHARWYLGAASWILVFLAIGVAVGTASTGVVLLLIVGAVVPPLMMLVLRNQTPSLIAAENTYNLQGRK